MHWIGNHAGEHDLGYQEVWVHPTNLDLGAVQIHRLIMNVSAHPNVEINFHLKINQGHFKPIIVDPGG